jgi:hypothetical protein
MELIDRSKLEPDTEWSDYYDEYVSYSAIQIKNAPTVNAISIPEGATNGDMMKAVFPDESTFNGGEGVGFKKEWWDAPYRKVKE